MASATTTTGHGRTGHPFALGLWAQLRDRSDVERRYLHDLLLADLGLATLSGKKEAAGEALRRFIDARALEMARAADQGSDTPASWACGSPSRRSYDVFRADQPSAREWPSSSYIRNAFDNDWQAALAAIGHEPAVDVTSQQLTAAPKPYSRDEILAALRIWIAQVDREHGPESRLLQAQYETWARAKRSVEDPRITRLPRASTLHRFIGDWREVLAALGCAHRHWQAQAPSSEETDSCPSGVPDEPAAGLDLESAPPDLPRKSRYVGSNANAARAHANATVAWLRWLAEHLPEEQRASLRMEDFDRYMSSVRRLSLAQGKPLRPPSHASIERSPEIDGWLHAKYLAGMIRGKAPVKRSSKAFSKRELVDAVTAALRDLGPDMNRAQYTRWKDDQDRRLPSASTLRRSFSDTGSWSAAIETALRHADEPCPRSADRVPSEAGIEPGQREAA